MICFTFSTDFRVGHMFRLLGHLSEQLVYWWEGIAVKEGSLGNLENPNW